MDKQTDLISRLQDEADLCRNDGASDIAALLDEAAEALRYVDEHGMSTNSAPLLCQRVMADGQPCGLPPGCPDCGRCLVDVGIGA